MRNQANYSSSGAKRFMSVRLLPRFRYLVPDLSVSHPDVGSGFDKVKAVGIGRLELLWSCM